MFWKFPDKKAVVEDVKKSFPFARFYSVFNVEQLDGVPAVLPFEVEPFDAIEDAEKIVAGYMLSASHPTLGHGGDGRIFRPSSDHVQMPEKTAFSSPAGYYATLFHEFAHSTGIKARCNRAELIESDGFSGEIYSKEELTAEFAAAFLSAEAGISNDQLLANSAAYIQSWVKKLKNDNTMVVQASQRAQRASDYILQRSAAPASDDAVAVA